MADFYNSSLLAQDFSGGGPIALNANQPNQFGVQNLTDLVALLPPADKSVCYVEDELAEYFYDTDSLTPINGITVLKPGTLTVLQPGRWKLQKADISNLIGSLIFQGTWNAAINSPDLTVLTPPAGYYWYVATAGTTSLGGITAWTAGDLAVSTGGGNWVKIDGTSGVLSVNGQAGVVTLDTDDISEGSVNLYFTTTRARASAVADAIINGVLDIAPSQNAVFDALTLKADRWVSVDAAINYTAAYGDLVAITAASVVVSLPAGPTAAEDGKSIIVKRRHAGLASSVSGNGKLIDGSASVSLTTNGTAFQFVWNNTSGEWNQV